MAPGKDVTKSSSGGGGGASKKYYSTPGDKNSGGARSGKNDDGGARLFPSSKLRLLHQRTSLSLAYDRAIGWGFRGETALYIVVHPEGVNLSRRGGDAKDDRKASPSSMNGASAPLGRDGKPVELALHLRDGCFVESVNVFTAARETIRASDACENVGGDSDEVADASGAKEEKQTNKTTPAGMTETIALLHPLPHHSISFAHHDPLSVFMTRPAKFDSVDDAGNVHFGGAKKQRDADATGSKRRKKDNQTPRRHEADAHGTRGTKGMTYSLRAASISSALGELRVCITPSTAKENSNVKNGSKKSNVSGVRKSAGSSLDLSLIQPPQSEAEAVQCWKDDLSLIALSGATGETPQGTMERKMNKEIVRWRCKERREARLVEVAKTLAEASVLASDPDGDDINEGKWSLSPAMKIVVCFSLATTESTSDVSFLGHLNLGGIHFLAPNDDAAIKHPSLSTPHVYTVCGSHGDHQGVRSWLPTLDSASPLHRASHEITLKVTAERKEGLWPCASGEDFGHNRSVSHPVLGNNTGKHIFGPMKEQSCEDKKHVEGVREVERTWNTMNIGIAEVLGRNHTLFVNDFFCGAAEKALPEDTGPCLDLSSFNSEVVARIRHIHPEYVTSIFSSLMWSPCSSRSLGFAVGPFATLYDPEYFRLDNNDDDDSDNEVEDGATDGENGSPLSLSDTARRLGEGIRQLYFAPEDDRPWIHSGVNDESIFGLGAQPLRPRPELFASQLQERRLLEGSILASTIGVPNRALSLMRDVLALPAYRTSSYTQIWIPHAHMSGSSCGGNMAGCPEVSGCNPFLGGSILDGSLLPPPGMRLPFYDEGRSLQFLQARCAIRGWVRAALPLGADDDVGQGYLHALAEAFVMSLYERGHGAFGEGGGKGSFYYTKRYAIGSGLNSPNLDFLPLANIEDDEVVVGGGLGAIAIEERGKEHLWRSASNGTETHTSSLDEFAIGQLQAKDFIEALERSDKSVPLPSMGWMGSHQSATFLSHNSASSTHLGCGALDFVHPMGGQMYRAVKAILLSRVYEGRSSISHFMRVVRAAFIASFLRDGGISQLKLPQEEKIESDQDKDAFPAPRPPFVVCVDELIKKQALSHTLLTRALRVMSGPIHETYLRGNLVDIGRNNFDSRFERKLVTPEGFPNSFVRGSSGLYLRVGVHIEAADGSNTGQSSASAASQSAAAVKGIHLHVVAEPVIPEGGSAFGGPVTLRVIENEGQCREFVKNIPEDGSRIEWGPVFLHARPVSTAKQQQAASGISDAPATTAVGSAAAAGAAANGAVVGGSSPSGTAFTSDHLHRGGFQALELIRITNTTPLLWVRVDPHGLYNGRLSIFQQDACLAEQLFHDGDAAAQVEAMRALAERPTKIQGTFKMNNVHDVPIAELPVRVLGDCLRGSVALHCDLPHNPAVRAQAALAIAQWQNNKAPESRDVVGGSAWLGLDLLLQYFSERYCCNGVVLPVNFRRCVLHKHIAGGASGGDTTSDGGYQYLDALMEKDDRRNAIEFADEVEIEEDEEYRVRSACITAIASIRAQDGLTPKKVVKFLEEVLLSGDKAATGSLLLPDEEDQIKKKQDNALDNEVAHNHRIIGPNDDDDVSNLPYVSFSLVADALLALCYVHVRPQCDFDPTAGARSLNHKAETHPILPLMKLCLGWLDWDLERMRLHIESSGVNNLTGVGNTCHATIAPCAITALCHMALLKQSTTSTLVAERGGAQAAGIDDDSLGAKQKPDFSELDQTTTAQFYVDIYKDEFLIGDSIRAAAAQSVVCICCAADRDEGLKKEPLGLLVSLEFLLDQILEPKTSPGLRLSLALLMMDACTGKICSLQRVGSFCGQNRLCASGSRFMNGPLGASFGGDNGSALLLTVSDLTYPAANAVNDGARRGLRLLKDNPLKDNCKDNTYSSQTMVRVSKFASKLWRTINGETVSLSETFAQSLGGVCAHDNHLRCALVALWQWIWPVHCWQIKRAQSFHAMEGQPQYYSLGLNHVMKTTAEEKEAAQIEDQALAPLVKVVKAEIDRQKWRGEMANEAYKYFKSDKDLTDAGQPLPLVEKDAAWKLGGWVASTAQQRRMQGADGGHAVTKIRLNVKNSTGGDNS